MKNTVYYLLLIAAAFYAGLYLSRCVASEQMSATAAVSDTVTIHTIDTISIPYPIPEYISTTDTLYIRDTVTQTVIASLPIETKFYEDSLYRAQISGVHANLEYIEVFPRTEYKYIYQTETVSQKPKKWGLGVSAGYAFTGSKMQPYVGIGVTYDLLQW